MKIDDEMESDRFVKGGTRVEQTYDRGKGSRSHKADLPAESREYMLIWLLA